uniref:Serpin peptidase inhibitor, clade E (nexin, plasminogen activator inhibitor type 1), member 3 n=1 Tax=Scleropages formosus TaxID=113540 RepID=A0A8C9QUN0_SCLFO
MGHVSLASLLVCLWLLGGGHGGLGGLGETLGELHSEFAVSLYQSLSATDNDSNLILSPLSVSVSLGLLQFGARGRTLVQLEEALKYDANGKTRDFLLRVQGDVGNSSQSAAVRVACGLFIQRGTPLCPAFTQHYQNLTPPAHTLPNQPMWGNSSGWAEPPGDPVRWAEPQMALVSTVAFRGTWQKQFQHAETQSLPFTLADGTVSKVPMMYQATDVLFGQFHMSGTPEHRYTVLELPYLGGSVGLLLVLPGDRKIPLSHLEPQLSARTLATWEAGLRRTKMDVFLPRFRIQKRVDLRSVLSSLGVSDIFDPAVADFRGISGGNCEGLYVSQAVHEAKVEVTEDGTKAGAATGKCGHLRMFYGGRGLWLSKSSSRTPIFILRTQLGLEVLFTTPRSFLPLDHNQ